MLAPNFVSTTAENDLHPSGLYNIGYGNGDRTDLLAYLSNRKEKDSTFTILDVGGSMFGWSAPIVDYILDINVPSQPNPRIQFIRGNINRESDWNELLRYVAEHGKFSFVLCTHTLEDIAFPTITLEMLPRVAKEGFIAVPSKYRELSHIESPLYRGYMHHRWICDVRDGIFYFYPKLNFIEQLTHLHGLADMDTNKYEIRIWWKDTIPYKIINDDYLGPSPAAVFGYYDTLLNS